MRSPKWLPWTVGIAIPVSYLALTPLRTQNPEPAPAAPQAAAPAPTPEKTVPNLELKARKAAEKIYGSGNDLRKVVYRFSEKGSPLTCDIFDAEGTRLLKYRFAYATKPGPLYGKTIEVQAFDAQIAPVPQVGKDTPLERLIYTYDDTGVPRPPLTVNTEPTGIATKLRGPALVAFNPLTDGIAAAQADVR